MNSEAVPSELSIIHPVHSVQWLWSNRFSLLYSYLFILLIDVVHSIQPNPTEINRLNTINHSVFRRFSCLKLKSFGIIFRSWVAERQFLISGSRAVLFCSISTLRTTHAPQPTTIMKMDNSPKGIEPQLRAQRESVQTELAKVEEIEKSLNGWTNFFNQSISVLKRELQQNESFYAFLLVSVYCVFLLFGRVDLFEDYFHSRWIKRLISSIGNYSLFSVLL